MAPASTGAAIWIEVALNCGPSSWRASSMPSCEPYHSAPMIAHQQRAQLVDALDDLAAEQARLGLDLAVRHLQLAHAQHRVVARVIGVVHGRPVDGAIALVAP